MARQSPLFVLAGAALGGFAHGFAGFPTEQLPSVGRGDVALWWLALVVVIEEGRFVNVDAGFPASLIDVPLEGFHVDFRLWFFWFGQIQGGNDGGMKRPV